MQKNFTANGDVRLGTVQLVEVVSAVLAGQRVGVARADRSRALTD